jgi:hypothetical protein
MSPRLPPVSGEVAALVDLAEALLRQVQVRRAQQPRLPDAEVLDVLAETLGPVVPELRAVLARQAVSALRERGEYERLIDGCAELTVLRPTGLRLVAVNEAPEGAESEVAR